MKVFGSRFRSAFGLALAFAALTVLVQVVGCDDETPRPPADTVSETDSVEDVLDGQPDLDQAPELSDDGDTPSELDVEDADLDPDESPDLIPDESPDEGPDSDELAELEQVDDELDPDVLVGPALREALHQQVLSGHTPLGYDGARDYIYAIGGIDDINGRIECFYTGRSVDANGSRTPGNNCTDAEGNRISCSLNTEHTWARYHLRQALGDGSPEFVAAEGDIHHLFPSDAQVNNARWHFPFGSTLCQRENNCRIDERSQLGLVPGGSGNPACPTGNLEKDEDCHMQVRPERRGDLARVHFYMAVRYEMSMDDAIEAEMRLWHEEDPVDAREQARNQGAFEAQGNRNPFVDQPELVDRIFDF
ncbi:MAG: endonuclease [Myxococcota bacterium]|jgi:endonuclease I|nr:endonuclease [Myxococcota bacterium]